MKSVGESAGYKFGGQNLFGSGIMKQAMAESLADSLAKMTQFVQKGQFVSPVIGTKPSSSWKLGF